MEDFRFLPDVVLVKAFRYLNLNDRANAALVCRCWADAFDHPSLWSTAQIVVQSCPPSRRPPDNSGDIPAPPPAPGPYIHWVEMSPPPSPPPPKRITPSTPPLDQRIALLTHKGRLFRDLKLTVLYTQSNEFHNSEAEVIEALNENCCELDSLVLGVEKIQQLLPWHGPVEPEFDAAALLPIETYITSLRRLKKLTVRTWPRIGDEDTDPTMTLLNTLSNNTNVHNMKELNLLWAVVNHAWSVSRSALPSEDELVMLLGKLTSLERLSTLMSLLTENVLATFARPRRTKLMVLKLLVAYQTRQQRYWPYNYERVSFDETVIPSTVWKTVRENNPKLTVNLTFTSQIQHVDFSAILKPYIPLVSIEFMKYSKCTSQCLVLLAELYSSSLEVYKDFSDNSNGVDRELIELALKCTRLSCFVHHGIIGYDTVLSIAEARKESLESFDVLENHIVIEDYGCNQDNDDDNDECMFLWQQKAREERRIKERRNAMLVSLYGNVSLNMGRKWKASII